MEQQINEEVAKSTPDPMVEEVMSPQGSHVGNKHVLLACCLLLLVALLVALFLVPMQSKKHEIGTSIKEDIGVGDTIAERAVDIVEVNTFPEDIQPSLQIGDIQFNTEGGRLLKTVLLPEDADTMPTTMYVLDIGTITSGQFQNKKLGIAFRTSRGMGYETPISEYAYFIVDQSGSVIAWDKNFIHATEECFVDTVCTYKVLFNTFNLHTIPEQQLDFLPKEFRIEGVFLGNDRTSLFETYGLLDPSTTQGMSRFEGKTESGFTILRSKGYGELSVSSQTQYWVEFPFNTALQVSPSPTFFSEANGLPQITWTTGTTDIASYNYGQYAYGWDDCYEGISETAFNAGLLATGVTVTGDPLYEIDPQKFPNVYACLHEKTKRYDYNPVMDTGTYVDTVSYADFIKMHPMFFWRHPIVGLLGMVRSDVVPAAEKAKPVVYLYPEKKERIRVSVLPVGGFTITDPEYGNGWTVDATPEGRLTNVSDGKEYPYLFWEGGKEGVVQTPKEGFVIARENIHTTLETTLTELGLNDQERFDFLEFWVPKLSRAPYYFVTFIDRSEIDRVAPMRISPTPDTVIRVLMDYKPLEELIEVEPLHIEKIERRGFVAVEWGGIVRD